MINPDEFELAELVMEFRRKAGPSLESLVPGSKLAMETMEMLGKAARNVEASDPLLAAELLADAKALEPYKPGIAELMGGIKAQAERLGLRLRCLVELSSPAIAGVRDDDPMIVLTHDDALEFGVYSEVTVVHGSDGSGSVVLVPDVGVEKVPLVLIVERMDDLLDIRPFKNEDELLAAKIDDVSMIRALTIAVADG